MEKPEANIELDLSDPAKEGDDFIPPLDLKDKDEALRLVGLERTEKFTPEQYLAVRKKMVSFSNHFCHYGS